MAFYESLLYAKPIEELPLVLANSGCKRARKLQKAMLQKPVASNVVMEIGNPHNFMHHTHALTRQEIRSIGTTHSSSTHNNPHSIRRPGDATRLVIPITIPALRNETNELAHKLSTLPQSASRKDLSNIRNRDHESITSSTHGTLGKQMLFAVRNLTLY
jgi:hypothetical protein